MAASAPTDHPLPPLRPDLTFHPGPADIDGSPTFTVLDPASGSFCKLGWAEALVLRHFRQGATAQAVADRLRRDTTLHLSPAEVYGLAAQAKQNRLLVTDRGDVAGGLLAASEARRVGPVRWLLHHYLYFRVPLLHPDPFLRATLPWIRPLFSRAALKLYALLSLLGVYLLVQRLDVYVHAFPDFFSWRGALAYGVTLSLIKLVHEFSHAFVARHFGARVPTMGVAFIIFWPVPFSDVTDAWKLKRRRERFLIGFAGVGAELVLAGLATLLWSLTPGGALHDAAFLVSSASLISTLLVNINPAMRFDGYYLLTDLLGVDNLQQRAFALTKWRLHKALLGLDQPPPEPNVPPRRLAALMAYSIYAWIYRFFLYLSIAVLIYSKFTKLLGIVLFVVEIWWFVAMPVMREARMLWKLRPHLRWNPRLVATLCALTLFAGWLILPLTRPLALPALVRSEREQTLYAPQAGRIRLTRPWRIHDPVPAGTTLAWVESLALATRMGVLQHERAILRLELERAGFEKRLLEQHAQIEQELYRIEAERDALRATQRQNRIVAESEGTLIEWDESLHDGQPVSAQSVLGRLAARNRIFALAYVREAYVEDLAPGQTVRFLADSGPPARTGTIRSVAPVAAERIESFALTARGGGDITVRVTPEGVFQPRETLYRVEVVFSPGAGPVPLDQRGHILARTRRRSLLLDGLRYAWTVLLRETDF